MGAGRLILCPDGQETSREPPCPRGSPEVRLASRLSPSPAGGPGPPACRHPAAEPRSLAPRRGVGTAAPFEGVRERSLLPPTCCPERVEVPWAVPGGRPRVEPFRVPRPLAPPDSCLVVNKTPGPGRIIGHPDGDSCLLNLDVSCAPHLAIHQGPVSAAPQLLRPFEGLLPPSPPFPITESPPTRKPFTFSIWIPPCTPPWDPRLARSPSSLDPHPRRHPVPGARLRPSARFRPVWRPLPAFLFR